MKILSHIQEPLCRSWFPGRSAAIGGSAWETVYYSSGRSWPGWALSVESYLHKTLSKDYPRNTFPTTVRELRTGRIVDLRDFQDQDKIRLGK